METPLDVLSRAASLVQPGEEKNSLESAVNSAATLEDSPKVTPSTENRRKRNQERRDISQALNFDEGHQIKNGGAASMKTACTQTFESRKRQSEPTLWRSPVSPPPVWSRAETIPPPLISIVPKNGSTAESSSQSLTQSRPSVITTAKTSIMRSPVNFMPPSQLYAQERVFASQAGHHRREIISAVADPFVEEHFRRSLGKDYFAISPSATSVAGSVDEHFAKALGETWHKVKSEGDNVSSSQTHMRSIATPVN